MAELTLNPVRNAAAKQIAAANAARKTAGAATKLTRHAVRTSSRTAWRSARALSALETAMRTPSRRRRAHARTPELAAAALAGLGVEYLLDPTGGKRRRRVLRDRALAGGRRLARRASRRAQYLEGKAEGAIHQATSRPRPVADDQALADRVRSEVFRRPDAPKGSVNVGVVDRVVFLRGEVANEHELTRLLDDARRVPGVVRVENFLHLPGSPAPQGGAA
jgi:osmotically-inducible protein OsmY